MKNPPNPTPPPAGPDPAEQAAAEQAFAAGAHERGEVAPPGTPADAPGQLFEQSPAAGELVRKRFSLLPPAPPAE